MALLTVKRSNGKSFPSNTRLRIETLPERHLIFEGVVNGDSAIPVDPGKYVSVAKKMNSDPHNPTGGVHEIQEHLVGCTEQQWYALRQGTTNHIKARMTSDGMRYFCKWPNGCDAVLTSRTGGVLHEAEHTGVDLYKGLELAEPQPPAKQNPQSKQVSAR